MSATDQTIMGRSFGSPGYRRFVLGFLTLVYTLNFVDRILIAVISRPIIEEFSLSNFQFGLITGLGFALFYTALGIPIAQLSERHRRVTIIGVCVILWSLATVMCGFTVGFITLLLARMAVGVGEAGCTPPANSLICDYFRPSERPAALGVYATGTVLGGFLAYLLGGTIIQIFTWREAFIYVGAPGVVIGLLLLLVVREPPRGYSEPAGHVRSEKPSLRSAMAELRGKPTFWLACIAMATASFAGYSLTSFKPLYIQYQFGISPGTTAVNYLAPIAFVGALGSFSSGFFIQRFTSLTPKATIWVPALTLAVCAPLQIAGFLSPSVTGLLIFFGIAAFFQYFYVGASFNIVQSVTSVRVRATAIAVLLFVVNMIGYGGGPPVFGAIADLYTNSFLADAPGLLDAGCNPRDSALNASEIELCTQAKAYGTRAAMILAALTFALASGIFLLCLRTFAKDANA